VKFVLNQDLVEEHHLDAHITLLQYLRGRQKLYGTKEGCASGDCGACTCVVGELSSGKLVYHSVNACITPLGALDGKHIVTVEHLGSGANTVNIHPVQAAMVECHGSQCGYCTPGFIMSLGVLHHEKSQNQELSREQICNAISGNLCRCTGYRPIIDAGLQSSTKEAAPFYNEQILSLLKGLQHDAAEQNTSSQDNFLRPFNLVQWRQAKLQHPEAPLIAGGTDLALEISTRYRDIPYLIGLDNIKELHNYTADKQYISLGAGLSYSSIETFAGPEFPELIRLFKRIASPQIRNRGTLGGNIANASPIADTPPPLLVMGAVLEITNSAGNTRLQNLDDFYIGYKQTRLAQDELITAIKIPKAPLRDFHRFYKLSKRYADDISSVIAAVRFEITDDQIASAAIAFGGMAAVPVLVKNAAHVFIGKAINDTTALEQAIAILKRELKPISDVRASADYRIQMAENLLRKAWMAANKQELPALFAEAGHA